MNFTDPRRVDPGSRRYLRLAFVFFLINVACMLVRYGQLPLAPVQGDEVIINDAAVSLGQGQGYAATSFAGSPYGIDHLFAHFPPLYPLTESLAIRVFGVSVYSLRLTTTVMTLCASAVLLLLLYFLVKEKVLDWVAASLVAALYCTCAPLIVVDRMARMESMVAVMVHLAFASVMIAAVSAGEREGASSRVRRGVIACGLFTGLALSVHPEAISAVIFLAPLVVLAVPGYWGSKALSALLVPMTPVVVWVLTFRSNSLVALRQFRAILHSATPKDDDIGEWLQNRLHDRNAASINRHLVLALILALVVLLLFWFVLKVRRASVSALRYRLATAFALGSALELVAMEWVFHMNVNRYQFLYGPLLVGVAMMLFGERRVGPVWRYAVCLIVALQLIVIAIYLAPLKGRALETSPDRFMPIIHSLPPSASVAATGDFWLDFKELGRPMTIIYVGHDGRDAWSRQPGNPLDRFDAVVLVENADSLNAFMQTHLAHGRARTGYQIGNDTVGVYLRDPSATHP
jgi:hypothetical protein